jgi:hypothetical protein
MSAPLLSLRPLVLCLLLGLSQVLAARYFDAFPYDWCDNDQTHSPFYIDEPIQSTNSSSFCVTIHVKVCNCMANTTILAEAERHMLMQ